MQQTSYIRLSREQECGCAPIMSRSFTTTAMINPRLPPLALTPPPTLIATLEAHEFLASAHLKIRNIRQIFEDIRLPHSTSPTATPVIIASPPFGPGFKLDIDPSASRLAVHLHVPDTVVLKRPFVLRVSVTATSYSGQVKYLTRSCNYACEKGTSDHSFLLLVLADHWRKHESLRSDNGLVLHIDVQTPGVKVPCLQSSRPRAVLDVLHKTVRGRGTADIRFTTFDRRSRSGRLDGRQIVHADKTVIEQNSPFLDNGACAFPLRRANSRGRFWNSLVNSGPLGRCSEDCSTAGQRSLHELSRAR